MLKYFLQYDIYERHKKVGSYIKEHDKVLDVGGELNHLSLFSSTKKIVVANLNTGDVIITKDKLPFAKNSFDVVTSIDVLEHIPKRQRDKFVTNLIKVASKKIILSFPLGTEKHIDYEKKLLSSLEARGKEVRYLSEHVRFGLPTYQDVLDLTRGYKKEIFFSGDIKINRVLFKIFMFDPKVKLIRKLVYSIKKIFNFLTNEILYHILTNREYCQNVNRAYVIIEKEKPKK